MKKRILIALLCVTLTVFSAAAVIACIRQQDSGRPGQSSPDVIAAADGIEVTREEAALRLAWASLYGDLVYEEAPSTLEEAAADVAADRLISSLADSRGFCLTEDELARIREQQTEPCPAQVTDPAADCEALGITEERLIDYLSEIELRCELRTRLYTLLLSEYESEYILLNGSTEPGGGMDPAKEPELDELDDPTVMRLLKELTEDPPGRDEAGLSRCQAYYRAVDRALLETAHYTYFGE